MQNTRHVFAIYRRVIIFVTIIMAAAFYAANPDALAIGPALAFLLLTVTIELSPVVLGDSSYAEVVVTVPVLWTVLLLFGRETAIFVNWWAVFVAHLVAYVSALMAAKWSSGSVLEDDGEAEHKRNLVGRAFDRLAGNWSGRHDYPVKYALSLIAFNSCGDSLSIGFAGLAYWLAGGKLFKRELLDNISVHNLIGLLIPLAIGLAVYIAVDVIMYSTNAVILSGARYQVFSLRNFYLNCRMSALGYLPVMVREYAFVVPFGLVLAVLYVWWGPISFVVLLTPFYTVRHVLWQTVYEWRSYRDTITTLGTLMQHYHPYTQGHLRRVAELSERLARELRRPPRSVMLMADAGMLHDIGKVGVSEEILDKVGKLTDEEWEVIRSHPVKGADIISHLPFLDQIVDWVKYHHKWTNGKGYPDDGAKDGEMPIEAEIIAVADAFDAMTDDRELTREWRCDSCGYAPPDGERPEECPQCHAPKHRVYREPLSLDDAIDQLRRGSGTQFKPDVVQAFLTMIDRDGVRLNAE